MLVEGLLEEDFYDVREDPADDLEGEGDDGGMEHLGEVLVGGVDPPEQEGLEPIRQSLMIAEELFGGFGVPLGLAGLGEGEVDDVVVGGLGLFQPLVIRSPLDPFRRPEKGILDLHHVQFMVEADGDDAVGGDAAGAEHDDGVDAVEPHDQEEVPLRDQLLLQVHILNFPPFQLDVEGLFEELEVGELHVLGDVGVADPREALLLGAHPPQEQHRRPNHRLYLILDRPTELVDADAVGLDVVDGGLGEVFEDDGVVLRPEQVHHVVVPHERQQVRIPTEVVEGPVVVDRKVHFMEVAVRRLKMDRKLRHIQAVAVVVGEGWCTLVEAADVGWDEGVRLVGLQLPIPALVQIPIIPLFLESPLGRSELLHQIQMGGL
mmetsp:Transcript_40586/g.39146  ORF Transcript_40586/g.39146 Transcript_40586/m.39146 type:complete len:376 (-) Transcript_40586:121-1248(-)